MRISTVALSLALGVGAAYADLEVIAPEAPQVHFAGGPAAASLMVRNPDGERREAEFSTRLFMLSSSIAMPVGEARPWKKVEVLAGQTILESIPLDLPEVRVATVFRVEIAQDGKVVARLPLLGCPREMLKGLSGFGGNAPIGLHDPDGKLKAALAKAGVQTTELDLTDNAASFQGHVAILGPVAGKSDTTPEWKSVSAKLAERGVGIVILVPATRATLSAEILRNGLVVVARGMKWDTLETSAQAQLALLRLLELAAPKPAP